MIVEIIYGYCDGEKFKLYVKLKHIISFDTENKRILFKKNKVGYPYVNSVQNFDELLKSWKIYHDNNL